MEVYKKTRWVDGETPVNAENMNKLETAVQGLTEYCIGASDICAEIDGGIMVNIGPLNGKVYLKLEDGFLKSESIDIFEVVESSLEVANKFSGVYILNKPGDQRCNLILRGSYKYPVTRTTEVQVDSRTTLDQVLSSMESDLDLNKGIIAELRKEINLLKAQVTELQKKLEDNGK